MCVRGCGGVGLRGVEVDKQNISLTKLIRGGVQLASGDRFFALHRSYERLGTFAELITIKFASLEDSVARVLGE